MNFLKNLFQKDEEIINLKKEIEELKKLKNDSPVEFIRTMIQKEGIGAGTCEKYLQSQDKMDKWATFYKENKDTIEFIKYMKNIDGIDIFQIFENVEVELQAIRATEELKTPEGRANKRAERRKNLK